MCRGGWRCRRGCAWSSCPPYSPELQPVERVWPLVNEAVANRYFHDLEEMMEVVAERCRVLAQDPETLRRHTLFHWWPRTKALA